MTQLHPRTRLLHISSSLSCLQCRSDLPFRIKDRRRRQLFDGRCGTDGRHIDYRRSGCESRLRFTFLSHLRFEFHQVLRTSHHPFIKRHFSLNLHDVSEHFILYPLFFPVRPGVHVIQTATFLSVKAGVLSHG